MKHIVLLYILFAVIATLANLGIQYMWLSIGFGPSPLLVAMFLGTGIGLVTKYLLDKKYIFQYTTKNLGHDLNKFLLYSIMGILTTTVFWASELTFHVLWDSPLAKYIGGTIGLAMGYTIKYFLDKKFVFIK